MHSGNGTGAGDAISVRRLEYLFRRMVPQGRDPLGTLAIDASGELSLTPP
jgi:hypothetical protein